MSGSFTVDCCDDLQFSLQQAARQEASQMPLLDAAKKKKKIKSRILLNAIGTKRRPGRRHPAGPTACGPAAGFRLKPAGDICTYMYVCMQVAPDDVGIPILGICRPPPTLYSTRLFFASQLYCLMVFPFFSLSIPLSLFWVLF